ncbi:hypothetical protein BR93DRAFT_976696 [Coniochaeta sp. PMI_546]|nr:hypothetical protein BR93DRAFT_976696 [Coniochaeta sp. PMI_546]
MASTNTTADAEIAPKTTYIRRPYKGSCHCGFIKYIAFISLPLDRTSAPAPGEAPPLPQTFVYRCNCTTCQKTGFFHVRLPSAPDDFALLSPLDPMTELADYTCFGHKLHWLFCRTCGVRCFSFAGKGELVELDMEKDLGGKEFVEGIEGLQKGKNEGEVTVWRPKKEGWFERGFPLELRSYFSLNAYTLEAGQEKLDLREWTEEKKVMYLDCLEPFGEGTGKVRTYERPHYGGAY